MTALRSDAPRPTPHTMLLASLMMARGTSALLIDVSGRANAVRRAGSASAPRHSRGVRSEEGSARSGDAALHPAGAGW